MSKAMGCGKLEGNLDLGTNRLIVEFSYRNIGFQCSTHVVRGHRSNLTKNSQLRFCHQSLLSEAGRSNSHFLGVFLNFLNLWVHKRVGMTKSRQFCAILDLGRRWSIAQTDVARTQSIQTWSRSLWETMGLWVGLGATRNRAKSLFAVQTLRPSPLLYSRNLVIFFLTQNHAFSQIINEKGHKSIWKLYLLLLILCIYVSYNI